MSSKNRPSFSTDKASLSEWRPPHRSEIKRAVIWACVAQAELARFNEQNEGQAGEQVCKFSADTEWHVDVRPYRLGDQVLGGLTSQKDTLLVNSVSASAAEKQTLKKAAGARSTPSPTRRPDHAPHARIFERRRGVTRRCSSPAKRNGERDAGPIHSQRQSPAGERATSGSIVARFEKVEQTVCGYEGESYRGQTGRKKGWVRGYAVSVTRSASLPVAPLGRVILWGRRGRWRSMCAVHRGDPYRTAARRFVPIESRSSQACIRKKWPSDIPLLSGIIFCGHSAWRAGDDHFKDALVLLMHYPVARKCAAAQTWCRCSHR